MSAAADQATGIQRMAPHVPSKGMHPILSVFALRTGVLLILGLAGSISSVAQQKSGTSPLHDAETLLAEHRLAEARTEALDQLKKHPTVEAYNLVGMIESNQQDYSAAIDSFHHALLLNPRSTKTLNNLGNVYAAQREWDLAQNEFRAVLRIAPANADANYNLGVLLMMKGSPADAIPHFQHVHSAQS